MYVLAFILRYLRSKLSPLFAALAVTLCTAMVIIVISIMGGFLQMMQQSVKTLEGDVIIEADLAGFSNYEILLDQLLSQSDQIAAASPLLKSYGLLKLPPGDNNTVRTVEVLGIDPPSFDAVVNYRKTLFWSSTNMIESLDRSVGPIDKLDPPMLQRYHSLHEKYAKLNLQQLGMTMQASSDSDNLPAIVPGLHVSPSNRRDEQGRYDILNNRTLTRPVTLTILPTTAKGSFLEPSTARFTVVNEFKSGLYEIDANRVFVPFEHLQKMLRMQALPLIDPDTGQPTGQLSPSRCSSILIRGQSAIPLRQLRDTVQKTAENFLAAHPDAGTLFIYTWEEKHATFLGAVQNEKFLITVLFCVVSLVAFTMIAVVFYMIVLAKTRDIGITRALGASPAGIATVFLGYGLSIGIIGSLLGLALASAIVLHINEIQSFLAQYYHWQMWNPQVYYFDRIPSRLAPFDITWIVLSAIASSVAGATISALAAAKLNPIESLRHE